MIPKIANFPFRFKNHKVLQLSTLEETRKAIKKSFHAWPVSEGSDDSDFHRSSFPLQPSDTAIYHLYAQSIISLKGSRLIAFNSIGCDRI